MRQLMKAISWFIFLVFIGLSSYANYLHGFTPHARIMLAVVPCGFAASVFILEGLVSQGRAGRATYAAIGFVALASGVASYLGLFGMARDSSVPMVQALLLPLAFDGVVLVASMGIRGFGLGHGPATKPVKRRDTPRQDVPAARDTVAKAPVPVSEPVSRPDVPVSRGSVPTAAADVRDTGTVSRVVEADDSVAKALEMLAEGRSKQDVADVIGCSVRTLNRKLAQAREGGVTSE